MTYIREIDGKWYAFSANPDNGQVYSIGKDNPKDGRWFANLTNSGIKYDIFLLKFNFYKTLPYDPFLIALI